MPRTRRTKADRMAFALLSEILAPDELQQLVQRNRLDVRSPRYPNRIYRVPRGTRGGGFVWVYEDGAHVMWICLKPTEPLPDDDVVLMHRTMILADEEDYLAKGNCIPVGEGADPIIWALARLAPPLE